MTIAEGLNVRDYDLILMGCSAGGLTVLNALLPELPADFRPTVVVGIHLSSDSRSMLSEILAPKCRIPVREPEDKETIAPGTIYFSSAGYHLLVEPNHSFSFSVEEPVHFSRPSIDVLFESAAIAYGERALGILLTGASHDGAHGLRQIHDRGGGTIVQDPSTAESETMPRSALELFQPKAILTVPEIGRFLKGESHGKSENPSRR